MLSVEGLRDARPSIMQGEQSEIRIGSRLRLLARCREHGAAPLEVELVACGQDMELDTIETQDPLWMVVRQT
jgi:hypothetical protein